MKIIEKLKNLIKKQETEEVSITESDEMQNIPEPEVVFEKEKISVGIIMIDNFEDSVGKLEIEDRPGLVAKVEKALYDWANVYEGLVIKTDRDTFAIFFEEEYMEQIEEDKFDILDKIKEVSGDMQVTLSIAITADGNTNFEKYKNALAAVDIALGRGGDQAILRKDGKYVFFGGKTEGVEKRTKVRARIVSHALLELVESSLNVVIMGHTNIDIDAMGAAMGILRIAKTLDKPVFIVNDKTNDSVTSFIEEVSKQEEYEGVIITREEALNLVTTSTLLVVVDTGKTSYVEVPELLDNTDKIVVIDHHRKTPDFIENASLVFHEVYASSACELVTELIEYSPQEIALNELETQGLYAGIMMDTKNFTFKTGVRTFEAAAFLRKNGVDIIKVKKWFQSDLETYNKIAKIVEKTEKIKEHIAIAVYDVDDDVNCNVICAKAADELLTINDINVSFVLGKLDKTVYISGRSIGDINVQLILEKMGGGGHLTLAGAQVEGKDIKTVKKELIKKIEEYYKDEVAE